MDYIYRICNVIFFFSQGSMISPSDEDSFTFTVSAANGDIFKLRGKCDFYWCVKPMVFFPSTEKVSYY